MRNKALASLPLTALRAFEATARLGSIKAAAAELSVTPGAVSHHVQTLEAHLGTALFERLHRALRLTPAGEMLGESATDALGRIGRTLDELADTGLIAGDATLSVSAAPTFAAKWLAPRLHAFQHAHPAIALRLRADDALTDPARDRQVDVAVRYGPGPYASDLACERLWPRGVVVAVCSPALAAGFDGPGDLVRARLLRTAPPSGCGPGEPIGWTAWFAAVGVRGEAVERAVGSAPRVGTTQLALEAAIGGHGVALSPRVLVDDDLKDGRLAAPFATELCDPYAFWLLYRRERADESKIRKFVAWLRLTVAPVSSTVRAMDGSR